MSTFLQLAPMQALTESAFMNSYQQVFGGFTEMMTPYLSANSKSPIKIQTLNKHFNNLDKKIKVVPQLLSNDADGFIYYANKLYELGFDKVNWNLGCPFPTVTKKIRGAGLLPYPEKIGELLKKISAEIKPKLSVKIRLGMDSNEDIFNLIDILNLYPIFELIIHPRTASQKYDGIVDKETFGKIYQQFKMPIVYNGDIITKEHVNNLNLTFPDLKGFMIGRGAFINPFITQQINGIHHPHDKKLELFMEFYFNIHEHYKQTSLHTLGFLGKMKEMWWYFSKSFEDGGSFFSELRTINEVTAFEKAVYQIFTSGKLIY